MPDLTLIDVRALWLKCFHFILKLVTINFANPYVDFQAYTKLP